MDPELFLRGVTKRHQPPFIIEPVKRVRGRYGRYGSWHEQMSRWNLLDGDGYVVRRFSKWRYAYCALVGMCARTGVEAPIEAVARRYTREATFARVRSKEASAWDRKQYRLNKSRRGGKRVRQLRRPPMRSPSSGRTSESSWNEVQEIS